MIKKNMWKWRRRRKTRKNALPLRRRTGLVLEIGKETGLDPSAGLGRVQDGKDLNPDGGLALEIRNDLDPGIGRDLDHVNGNALVLETERGQDQETGRDRVLEIGNDLGRVTASAPDHRAEDPKADRTETRKHRTKGNPETKLQVYRL